MRHVRYRCPRCHAIFQDGKKEGGSAHAMDSFFYLCGACVTVFCSACSNKKEWVEDLCPKCSSDNNTWAICPSDGASQPSSHLQPYIIEDPFG